MWHRIGFSVHPCVCVCVCTTILRWEAPNRRMHIAESVQSNCQSETAACSMWTDTYRRPASFGYMRNVDSVIFWRKTKKKNLLSLRSLLSAVRAREMQRERPTHTWNSLVLEQWKDLDVWVCWCLYVGIRFFTSSSMPLPPPSSSSPLPIVSLFVIELCPYEFLLCISLRLMWKWKIREKRTFSRMLMCVLYFSCTINARSRSISHTRTTEYGIYSTTRREPSVFYFLARIYIIIPYDVVPKPKKKKKFMFYLFLFWIGDTRTRSQWFSLWSISFRFCAVRWAKDNTWKNVKNVLSHGRKIVIILLYRL